ncbi:patatin-like phospholipase family protein [Dongia sp.]|uniref:patatin-like phospholipase family protein n=1 Tax=Dongia sp. TaxID=1977262 RepID=UPI0035B2B1D2
MITSLGRAAFHTTALFVCMLALAACGTILRQAAPVALAEKASMVGFSEIRFYPLTDPAPARKMLETAFFTETPESYEELPDGSRVYSYLSVSGGGSDGAFGAGLINGWTEAGSRPHFKVVTGVSTGALIAPFAFLGPEYDAVLKKSYTTVDASAIFIVRSLLSILWAESLTDTAPLKSMVASYIDEKVLDAIAKEHAKGRRLLVATSNLDAEQPVIWDMGAIASSKDKKRLDLFRTIMVASASIPMVFPPAMINVDIDGNPYDEMHVDGGVFLQSFSIASVLDLDRAIAEAHPDFKGKVVQRLYVIRNGRVTPEPRAVDRSLGSITMRAIGTMLKMSGVNDLYRLYLSSLHDNVEFRFIAIPPEFETKTSEQFVEEEMIRQYDFGREMALSGIPWRTTPPGYTPE